MKEEFFKKYIEVKPDGRLKHRDKKDLEFKQNYNFAAIKEGSLAKSVATFANTDGGISIFGIKDKPREPIGMSNNNFENTEIEKITNLLNEYFSPEIKLDIYDFNIDGKKYGVFKIEESKEKPIVCKKNTKHLTESDIYYRYSARTEKIKYSELRKLLDDKRDKEQKKWMEHIRNIAKIGVENVTLMDVFRGTITHENNKQIVIDNSLLKNMNLIKEGRFVDKNGAPALKLIGEIEGVEFYSPNMNLNEDWYTTKGLGQKLGLLTKKNSTVYMTVVIWQYNIQEQSKYFQSKKTEVL